MGYGITMTAITETTIMDTGITYNVAAHFRKALGADGLNSLNGVIGKDCDHHIARALEHIRAKRTEYELLDPDNEWGSTGGVISLLEELLQYCVEYPEGVIHIT